VCVVVRSNEDHVHLVELFASLLLDMRVLLLVQEILHAVPISNVKLVLSIDQLLLPLDDLPIQTTEYLDHLLLEELKLSETSSIVTVAIHYQKSHV
jgi:hypothetical protein